MFPLVFTQKLHVASVVIVGGNNATIKFLASKGVCSGADIRVLSNEAGKMDLEVDRQRFSVSKNVAMRILVREA